MSSNLCEKCNKNPQSGKLGQDEWNLCSDCLKGGNPTMCGECGRVKELRFSEGGKWENPLIKQWYEDTAKHKSNCPKSYCSSECEAEAIKKNPGHAKDYGEGKGNEDNGKDNQPIEIIMLLSVISVKPNSTTIVANNFLGLLTKNMEIFVLLA